MSEHNLFHYPYASFTNARLPLLKVAVPYFGKLYTLDPVGASWATIDADDRAREAVMQLKDASILQMVTPAHFMAKCTSAVTNVVRRDMHDWDTPSTRRLFTRWTVSPRRQEHSTDQFEKSCTFAQSTEQALKRYQSGFFQRGLIWSSALSTFATGFGAAAEGIGKLPCEGEE